MMVKEASSTSVAAAAAAAVILLDDDTKEDDEQHAEEEEQPAVDVVRFAASKVASVVGLHEFGDPVEEFLEVGCLVVSGCV